MFRVLNLENFEDSHRTFFFLLQIWIKCAEKLVVRRMISEWIDEMKKKYVSVYSHYVTGLGIGPIARENFLYSLFPRWHRGISAIAFAHIFIGQIQRWHNTGFKQLLLRRIISQLVFQRIVIAAKMFGTNACGVCVEHILATASLYPLRPDACIFWKFEKIENHFARFFCFFVIIFASKYGTIDHFITNSTIKYFCA